MKNTMLVLAAALVFSAGTSMQAQSLKDLLNKDNIKNVVSAVADRLDIIPENIAGTWEYSGAAVEFTSDNTLAGAASVLASGKVEEKLDEYLAKIGLEDGLFVYTFNADSTFSTTFKKMTFSGTYSFSPEEDTIVLDYGKTGRLKGVSLKTGVSVSATDMKLLFNADGIIDFLARISSSAGDSKLKALNALISQYDGMKIGFELKRKN